MSRNCIDLDQINARLGISMNQQTENSYAEVTKQNSFGNSGSNDSEPEPPLSDGAFYSCVIGLFIVVIIGVFFSNDLLGFLRQFRNADDPNFVSIVDASCGAGWRVGVPNHDQIHCYLVREQSRLCKPDEKARLLTMLDRYSKDKASYDGKFAIYAMGSMAKASASSMQLGVEDARSRTPGMSEAEKEQHHSNAAAIAHDALKMPADMPTGFHNKTYEGQVQADITALAKLGYISSSDFSWTMPDFIRKGLEQVDHVNKVCPVKI